MTRPPYDAKPLSPSTTDSSALPETDPSVGVSPFPPGTARLGRLPAPLPQELDGPRRQLYEAITTGERSSRPRSFPLTDRLGRLQGPFGTYLLEPAVGDAVQQLGAAIRFRSVLEGRLRELAILQLAWLTRCEYEWSAHEAQARGYGIPEIEIEAVRNDEPFARFPPRDQLVRRLVIALYDCGDLDSQLYAEAVDALGWPGLQDLLCVVGYYQMLATLLRVWRIPLPDGVSPPWPVETEIQM
jgi:4-carboxymuconolactone decarboxylase